MAVAGKSYMIEFNRFKEGYRAPVDEKTLKKENIKEYASIKWKHYMKLVYNTSYSTVKRCIDIFKFCAAFPVVCWCDISPSKLYETNLKFLQQALADYSLYRKLERKVIDSFSVSTTFIFNF